MTSTTAIQTNTAIESTNQSPVKVVASPAKALQNIVAKKLSGRLTIWDSSDNSIFWRVYCGNGQVHFASSGMGQKERLLYFMQWYYPELNNLGLKAFKSDYEVICHYWKSDQLSLLQTRKLLFWLTEEAFIQLLALPQAALQFDKTVGLDPLLLSVPLKPIVVPMRAFIGQWAQLRQQIGSPFKRPFIKDIERLPKVLAQQVQDVKFNQSLLKILSQNVSIYEAARHLKTDTLGLAILLQSLMHAGVLGMNAYQTQTSDRRPIIACIDDSKTIQRNVRLILEASGYRVLAIAEANRALTTLARHKPDLILMDINMPEINGYELCQMLRNSTLLGEIPIVMLTGRDGIVDKLRARMVGATDYITKPFQPQQLARVIQENLYSDGQKLVGNG